MAMRMYEYKIHMKVVELKGDWQWTTCPRSPMSGSPLAVQPLHRSKEAYQSVTG